MRIIFSLLLLGCSLTAQAQGLDAYEGRAAVEDQTPAKRDKALREALAQVLARVSGDPRIVMTGRTAAILARANTLLRSVGYDNSDKSQTLLVAEFDPAAVENALKQAGLPVWGVLAGGVEEVALSVHAVESPRDYARAMAAFQGLPGVKSLVVTDTEGGNLHLRLQVEGGSGRLAGALSVGNVLKREALADGTLAYILNR